jgi:multidrug resistance efflux pump
MDKENKNIILRSDEVQEIMSEVPGRLISWGTTVIFAIIMVLLVGLYFFKYPDVINSEITISANRPPAIIMSRATGEIHSIFVSNQQTVDSGMPLAVIENPADLNDIQMVIGRLKCLDIKNPVPEDLKLFINNKTVKLGAVQTVYADFLKALQNYIEFMKVNYYPRKINMQQDQLLSRKNSMQEIIRQKKLMKLQLENSFAVFRRDSLLSLQGVMSKEDYETSRNKLLQLCQSVSELEADYKGSEIEISKTEEDILDLLKDNENYSNEYLLELQNSFEKLQAQLKAWQQEFLLVSPFDGKVNLMGNWSENQNVQSGEALFIVVPSKYTKPIGKALLPSLGSGKVKVGQMVHARLNNYPDQEFGFVNGIVRSVSNVPSPDGKYVVEISFPKGLTTNYGIKIPVTGTLVGNAEIITNDKNLLERIFLPAKRLVKEHF